MFKIKIAETVLEFPCASGDTLARAGLRAGVGMPYECNVGSCGTCKVELVSGTVESAWAGAPALSDRDRSKNRILGCQSRPLEDCTIKVRVTDAYAPLHRPRRFHSTLVKCRDVTHDIREFQLRPEESLTFRPGQYALFSLPGVTGQRAYSMSNCPDGADWQFQIKRTPQGQATTQLFDRLENGQRVALDGPYGVAYLREDSPRDIVCIAGGSGIAPVLSIARSAMRNAGLAERALHFFYGGRGPDDICGEAELRELPGYGERLHFYPTISMPELDTEKKWQGHVGLAHEHVLRVLDAPPATYEYYFAGPPPMTQAVQRLLIQNKVPFAQIHFDQFF